MIDNLFSDTNTPGCLSDALEQKSIKTHVEYLLNTRQGSVAHLPNLGLPDLSEIYQALPHSSYDLMQAIKQCLQIYEPRLSNIDVLQSFSDSKDCVVNVLITATIKGREQARFMTMFANDGHAHVNVKV